MLDDLNVSSVDLGTVRSKEWYSLALDFLCVQYSGLDLFLNEYVELVLSPMLDIQLRTS